jgi:hypothetical protein
LFFADAEKMRTTRKAAAIPHAALGIKKAARAMQGGPRKNGLTGR